MQEPDWTHYHPYDDVPEHCELPGVCGGKSAEPGQYRIDPETGEPKLSTPLAVALGELQARIRQLRTKKPKRTPGALHRGDGRDSERIDRAEAKRQRKRQRRLNEFHQQ